MVRSYGVPILRVNKVILFSESVSEGVVEV